MNRLLPSSLQQIRNHLSRRVNLSSLRRIHNENTQSMHIVDDHLMANYLINPSDYNYFKQPSFVQTCKTFTDDKERIQKDIYYSEQLLIDKIGQEKYLNFCKQYTDSRTGMYSVEVGKEMLSWIHMDRCCIPKNYTTQFLHFGISMGLVDFQKFFKANAIHPQCDWLSNPWLHYHTLRVPERDVSKFREGFHMWGSVDVPETCFYQRVIQRKVEELTELNHWSNDFRRDGPLLEIAVPRSSSSSALKETFDSFLSGMNNELHNSLILQHKSDDKIKQRFRKLFKERDIRRKNLERYHKKVLGWKNDEPILRMQVMGIDNMSMERAWSKMSKELQERCVILDLNDRDFPESFLYETECTEKIMTIVGDVEIHLSLLVNLALSSTVSKGCLTAIEVPRHFMNSLLLSRIHKAGYNPLDDKVYIEEDISDYMIQLLHDWFKSIRANPSNANANADAKIDGALNFTYMKSFLMSLYKNLTLFHKLMQ